MDETRCKASVSIGIWSRQGQCNRKAWKDGWCKQHHPDSVKARRELSDQRYEERKKQQPWYKLQEAMKRIAELEAEVAALRTANRATCSNCEGLHAALVSIATCPECDMLMTCSDDCLFAKHALADGDTTACDMRDRARAALADAEATLTGQQKPEKWVIV